MKHFFFNFQTEVMDTSIQVFKILGIKKKEIIEGDSSHVLQGVYYHYSIFGVQIKLELNSYGYDDKYRYMLTVKKDVLSIVKPDEKTVDNVANIVGSYLSKFLKEGVMYEDNDELKPFITI